jgi:HPt (histidine-containing phosphotransfer) domain-containing protein
VDQALCKRLAARLGIDLHQVYSISEAWSCLNQAPKHTFDLVLTDYYLGDGTPNALLDFNQALCLHVLTEETTLVSSLHAIEKVQKPIQSTVFFKRGCQLQLNLTYLNEVAEGDLEFKNSLIKTAADSIDQAVEVMRQGIKEAEYSVISFQLHKIKSSIRAVGSTILADVELLERFYKTQQPEAHSELEFVLQNLLQVSEQVRALLK